MDEKASEIFHGCVVAGKSEWLRVVNKHSSDMQTANPARVIDGAAKSCDSVNSRRSHGTLV